MSNYWKKKLDELNQSNDNSSSNTKREVQSKAQNDYWKNKLVELEESNKKKNDDIAPVKTTTAKRSSSGGSFSDDAPTKKEERTWFSKSKGGFFSTVGGTIGDVAENLLTGIGEGAERLWDGALSLGAAMLKGQMMQDASSEMAYMEMRGEDSTELLKERMEIADTAQKNVSEIVAEDAWDSEAAIKASTKKILGVDLDDYSVLGEKTDSAVQSGGQMLISAGGQAVGIPWFLTTGTMSYGGEMERALNQGASFEEASLSAGISAGGEVLTEMLSGGISFGGKTLDDVLTKQLAIKISSKFWQKAAQFGLDVTGEAAEEWISADIGAFGQWLTYRSEEELKELLFSEEAMDEKIEAAIGGGLLGGVSNISKGVKGAVTGVDPVTELTKNEQKVFEAEVNNRITEAEKDGKKLTAKEKANIRSEVMTELEKGGISTEIIEEVLGGEDYKRYKAESERQEAIKTELDELQNTPSGQLSYNQTERMKELQAFSPDTEMLNTMKFGIDERIRKEITADGERLGKNRGSFLAESYNEKANRGKVFEADLSQYDSKQQQTIKNAVDSGILNNTRRTHEFVDLIARISADKGVSFDFTNNEKLKESGFAIDGKTVNGYVTKDGIALNIDSAKALNTTVGHEITHILEGTDVYAELQTALFDYAKSKNDYQGRYDTLTELYKDVEGADIDAELTADLVGDYLFQDKDFINRLSTEHRNIFQKIYDEIKYLCKVATAGSKEARELEKVKKAFEEAYRANGKAQTDTKYSLSDSDGNKLTKEQGDYFKDSKMRDDNGSLKVMYHGSEYAGFHEFNSRYSDDDTSFFFVDRPEVAESYSGSSEIYTAKSIRTIEDFNNFLVEIDETDDYKATEENGKYILWQDGDKVAETDTAAGLYDEFCDWTGLGQGQANYKVYLNLTNPLVVDAEGRNWNRLTSEFSQEIYDKIKSLTEEEKTALIQLAAWEDSSIFRDELQTAVESVERNANYVDNHIRTLASAAEKLGDTDMYRLFDIATDGFTEETQRENAVKYLNTREYAQRAKEQGYDGVIFNNIVDNGGFSDGKEGASTVAIAFNSNQIKSVANDKPTYDPDIRYSLSEDSEGRELSLAVQNRFAKSQVVDENGRLKAVYHGTASGEFTIFDKAKGSVDGDFGSGFYFTDNETDVENNYEGGGPDFDNKVARLAEQIEAEEEIDYEEAEERARKELFKGGHKFEVYLNIEKPAIVGETNLFEQDSYFSEYNQEDYDNEEDYYADVEQLVADDIDNIIWDIQNNVDIDSTDGIAEVLWEAFNEGGIGIEELKAKINELYLEDSEGNLVGNEVARQIIESLGYDGIIDPTVSSKWNMEMEEGTTHYIVFKPNQIKDVANQNPTDNPDIHKSLSGENETPKEYGNFNIYGKDIRYKVDASEAADIAPTQETVAPIAESFESKIDNLMVERGRIFNAAWELEKKKDKTEAETLELQRLNNQMSVITQEIETALDEKFPEAIYNKRDAENGWGNVYDNSVDAIRAALRKVNVELHNTIMQEVDNSIATHNPHTPMLNAMIAVGEDVRQETLTPMQGALLLNEAYNYGGADALERLYNGGTGNLYPQALERAKRFESVAPSQAVEAPIYNEPISEPTLTELEAQKAELEKQIFEANEAGDYDTVTRLAPEHQALLDRIAQEQEADAAFQSERLASLDDADAPIEQEAPIFDEMPDTTPLTKKAVSDIVKPIKETMGLSKKQTVDVKAAVEKYATTENASVEDLHEALREAIGNTFEEEFSEVKEVQDFLRKHKIKVSDAIKNDIADYNDLRLHHFGKVRISNQGIDVDSAYQELTTLFPEFFPAEIANPSDQFMRIIEVSDMARTIEMEYEVDNETIEEAANIITNGISEYRQSQTQKLAEAEAKRIPKVAPVLDVDIAPTMETTPVVKDAPVAEAYEAIRPQKPKTEKYRMKRVDPAPGENQQTAKVRESAPKPERENRFWSALRNLVLDKQGAIEDLSLKEKNRELMGKADFMLRSESRAQRYIKKNLLPVLKRVEKTIDRNGFETYAYHLLNMDRMTLADRYEDMPNKPVFGYDVTADMSREFVRDYEAKHPEAKELSDALISYNAQLRQMLVDNGVISQETADLWAEMYPHFMPIHRADKNGAAINVPLDSMKTGVNAPVKRATGGNSDMESLFDTIGERTEQTFRAIARNSFGLELMNTLNSTAVKDSSQIASKFDAVEGIEGILSDGNEELIQKGKNGVSPTFTVFKNGKRVKFNISEDLYDALKPASEILSNDITIGKGKFKTPVLKHLSTIQRALLTQYNPVFLTRNAIKDAQSVVVNSQHATQTYLNFPTAVAELSKAAFGKEGKWIAEYLDNGGDDLTVFDRRKKVFVKDDGIVKQVLGFVPRKISEANDFVEKIPRLAEYIASRKAGQSIEVSMLDAARVTTNFAAGGELAKFANRNGFTFLNASIQGFNQQVRNVREAKANGFKGIMQLTAKFAIAGLPVMLFNHLMWDDDEEYEELSDYVKDNYYIVGKNKDGKFVRIPKGREVAVIQNAFEQMKNLVTGDDEVDFSRFGELLVENIAPSNPLDNNVIAPIMQAATNKTWYGDDLVPTRLQDLPAEEQFDESTDAISKWLGETFNDSPYKINYVLDQYSGAIGDVVLPWLTPETDGGGLVSGFKDVFTTDGVMKNQNIGDFYEKVDELTALGKSSKATDEDVLRYKYINSVNSELGELYKQKREIQNSMYLSDDAKYDAVRSIQQEIVSIARNALNVSETPSIDGKYAVVGDRHYRLNDDGEWTKITDEQLVKQREVTSGLGITPGQYWGNRDEYNMQYYYPEKYNVLKEQGISVEDYKENYEDSAFIYTDDFSWAADNPGKYAISKAVSDDVMQYRQYTSDLNDIKADYDSKGKAISGSSKAKKKAYIFNLPLDDGQKYILYRSLFDSKEDKRKYNAAIVQYLDSRDDISYEDMKTILEELDMTLHSDGRVTW